MKAILLVVKPNQLVKILNGEKTIEVRKSKLPLNIPVYLYCTKGKPYLINFGDYEHPYKAGGFELGFDLKNIEGHGAEILNGKVVAKCMFSERIALKEMPIVNYVNPKDLKGTIYIINQLEIFDTPKELDEFGALDKAETKRYNGFCKVYKPITKAPKSWCYVEE